MGKLRTIRKVIVHVTDSPDSKDFNMHDISRWHKEMNFPQSKTGLYCGYHWVIRRNGNVENARFEYEAGAHCRGHNSDSIGIAWVGRDDMTKEQSLSLVKLLAEVCSRYGLEPKQVFGHRELNPGKTCPNIKEMDELRSWVEIEMNKKAV